MAFKVSKESEGEFQVALLLLNINTNRLLLQGLCGVQEGVWWFLLVILKLDTIIRGQMTTRTQLSSLEQTHVSHRSNTRRIYMYQRI